MKRKYSILRSVGASATRDPFGGGIGFSPIPSLDTVGSTSAARLESAELDLKDVRDLRRDPSVAAVAQSMPVRLIQSINVEKAPTSAWGIVAVGADKSPFTGAGVTVAVLDTGIDARHKAFTGVTLVEEDFTGTGNGDKNGHGTHTAGTIFGRDVDGQRIGVATGVPRALIGKVLDANGGGSSEGLFNGMNWALENGARVISMSLGFDFPGMVKDLIKVDHLPEEVATSMGLEAYRANLRMFDQIMRLIDARVAIDGGAVVVAAAGNESNRPEFELAASLPAAADNVVAVGAAAQAAANRLEIAAFSNTLPTLSAPGVNVLSAKMGGGLRALSGTSMATPHVAGVVALWWEKALAQLPLAKSPFVIARLIAAARDDVFGTGVDIADRGVGLVASPK